jgi:hypothetical protein
MEAAAGAERWACAGYQIAHRSRRELVRSESSSPNIPDYSSSCRVDFSYRGYGSPPVFRIINGINAPSMSRLPTGVVLAVHHPSHHYLRLRLVARGCSADNAPLEP